jgi:hypothetical protein
VQDNKNDVAVTIDRPVLFAGDTLVMSLTRQAVQDLGTYDTRLVIHKGGYAGTWGGSARGGKMFGSHREERGDPQAMTPCLNTEDTEDTEEPQHKPSWLMAAGRVCRPVGGLASREPVRQAG